MASAKVRAFLAIALPEAVKEEIRKFIQPIKSRLSKFRFLPPQNWHLTLHFLGDISEDQISLLNVNMPAFLKLINPFEFYVKGIGGFPEGGKHRLLWVGIDGCADQIQMVHEKTNECLDHLNFQTENRLFFPHVTIARSKEEHRCDFEKDEVNFTSLNKTEVTQISLFQSQLSSSRSIYRKIASFPLGLS